MPSDSSPGHSRKNRRAASPRNLPRRPLDVRARLYRCLRRQYLRPPRRRPHPHHSHLHEQGHDGARRSGGHGYGGPPSCRATAKSPPKPPCICCFIACAPMCNAVCHGHPPTATGFAAAGLGLDQALLPEVIVGLGQIPLVRYATPGTPDLSAVLEPLRPALRRAASRQSWRGHLRPRSAHRFLPHGNARALRQNRSGREACRRTRNCSPPAKSPSSWPRARAISSLRLRRRRRASGNLRQRRNPAPMKSPSPAPNSTP